MSTPHITLGSSTSRQPCHGLLLALDPNSRRSSIPGRAALRVGEIKHGDLLVMYRPREQSGAPLADPYS